MKTVELCLMNGDIQNLNSVFIALYQHWAKTGDKPVKQSMDYDQHDEAVYDNDGNYAEPTAKIRNWLIKEGLIGDLVKKIQKPVETYGREEKPQRVPRPSCPKCNKPYKTQKGLYRHLIEAHKLKMNVAYEESYEPLPPQKMRNITVHQLIPSVGGREVVGKGKVFESFGYGEQPFNIGLGKAYPTYMQLVKVVDAVFDQAGAPKYRTDKWGWEFRDQFMPLCSMLNKEAEAAARDYARKCLLTWTPGRSRFAQAIRMGTYAAPNNLSLTSFIENGSTLSIEEGRE